MQLTAALSNSSVMQDFGTHSSFFFHVTNATYPKTIAMTPPGKIAKIADMKSPVTILNDMNNPNQ
jgi:hypothetical protein